MQDSELHKHSLVWTIFRATPVGLQGRRMGRIPLNEVVGRARPLDPDTYEMAEVLAGLPEEISYR